MRGHWPSVMILLLATSSRADSQFSATVELGASGQRQSAHGWAGPFFAMGGAADLLFGADREGDFEVGPYVLFRTQGFDTAESGGGVTLLVPIANGLPLMISAGGFVDWASDTQPGLEGRIFWGLRSYNYRSVVALTNGIFVSTLYEPSPHNTAIVGGLSLDLVGLSLPLVFVAQAIRGRSSSAE